MRKVLSRIFSPLYSWVMRPQIRYKFIPIWNQFASENRKETILRDVFGFVNFTGVRDGDYLEFGIWKGGSLIAAYHYAKRFKNLKNMRFYGFDSFEGLPDMEGVDHDSDEFKKGEYSAGLDEVKKHLKYSGVDLKRVTLVPGWFNESLTEKTRKELPLTSAAVIYIDSDLYESAVPVFKFITPYVKDGTVIVFDDWYCYRGRADHGEQKAFAEWLKENPLFSAVPYHDFGWAGKAFIINTLEFEEH